jgi:hypothetical protein
MSCATRRPEGGLSLLPRSGLRSPSEIWVSGGGTNEVGRLKSGTTDRCRSASQRSPEGRYAGYVEEVSRRDYDLRWGRTFAVPIEIGETPSCNPIV